MTSSISTVRSFDIHHATSKYAHQVTTTIVRSFLDLPTSKWLCRDGDIRNGLYGQFRMIVDHAVEHGSIHHVIRGGTTVGASVWIPSDAPSIADYSDRLAAYTRSDLPRFAALDEAFHHAHPPVGERYDHLVFLGVDPQFAGAGIGSSLVRYRLATLDEHEWPAYGEAATIGLLETFYRAFGFDRYGDPIRPVDGADNGPWMQPMYRKPQRPARA